MSCVKDILNAKSDKVQFISPKATAYKALEKMSENNIGTLIVVEKKKVVGIISERDYAKKIILQNKTSKETLVEEVMSSDLVSVTPDASVEDAMVLMTEKRVRHLPVFKKTEFVGIISIGDVVKIIISNKDFLINHLNDYIAGKHYSGMNF